MEDIKEHKNGKFITLTFSTEGLRRCYNECKKAQEATGYDIDNAIVTWAVRHFLERWRWKYKKSLRHWLITELGDGTTEHVHLHGIVWADDLDDLEKLWQYGFSMSYTFRLRISASIVKLPSVVSTAVISFTPPGPSSHSVLNQLLKRSDW